MLSHEVVRSTTFYPDLINVDSGKNVPFSDLAWHRRQGRECAINVCSDGVVLAFSEGHVLLPMLPG